jgi:hypothetical protein
MSETAKHTPGKWIRYGGGKRRWSVGRAGGGYSICQMTRNNEEAPNATLIASAPDMRLMIDALGCVARLEGGEFCFECLRYSFRDGDCVRLLDVVGRERLSAAIAKATGASHAN